MLRIRLSRTGRKNLNLFRVVVADNSAPIKGRFVEILGFYNPNLKSENFKVDEKRLKYWLSVGAKPTDTINNLLVDIKLLPDKNKIKKTTKKKHKKKEEKAEKPAVIESPGGPKQGEGSAMEIPEDQQKPEEKPAETEPLAEQKPAEEKPKEEEGKPKEQQPPQKSADKNPPEKQQNPPAKNVDKKS